MNVIFLRFHIAMISMYFAKEWLTVCSNVLIVCVVGGVAGSGHWQTLQRRSHDM